jgi:hypothetical protein
MLVSVKVVQIEMYIFDISIARVLTRSIQPRAANESNTNELTCVQI